MAPFLWGFEGFESFWLVMEDQLARNEKKEFSTDFKTR
jgi:hypothetical protein